MNVIAAALRRKGMSARFLAFGLGLAVLATIRPAIAQIGSDRYAAIVVDARTGAILVAANPDEPRYPASLTKMMTIYMAFDALRDRRTTLNASVYVSDDAAAMAPSRLGLVAGSTLTVEDAILAMVTKSANDAAAALGEHLGGGSENRFAQMMTMKARAIGMRNTSFRNASGLPDFDQVTTARDMATLGRRLLADFPDQYHYFSMPYFSHQGRTHLNHNRLLQQYDGADGIKTGFVNDSGFNLVASARRDGVRLVAAVFGGSTGRERDLHMMALLDQGFAAMGVAPRGPAMAENRPMPRMVSNARAAQMRADQPRVALRRDFDMPRAGRATLPIPPTALFAQAMPRAGTTLLTQTSATRGSALLPPASRGSRALLVQPTAHGAKVAAQPASARSGGKAAATMKAQPVRLASLQPPRGTARVEQGDTGRGAEQKTRATARAKR